MVTSEEHQRNCTEKREGLNGDVSNESAPGKTKSPSNAAVLKAGLKPNLSLSEATTQLRVLCRKFAALTEKVKEETKVRKAAEREIQRLEALLDKSTSPVVASCRANTNVYVRELKDTQDKLRQELRHEKEKNERVVAKALELEREKNAILTAQPLQPTATAYQEDITSKHQTAWDKEQVYKIQSTLKLTIEELEEELLRKEENVQSYREQSQRDRVRIKALEDEICAKDEAQRSAQESRRQLEADLQQAQTDITNELGNMQRIHDQAQEDRALRDTLEQQIVTLNEVNTALEQRSRALVRRLELSSTLTQECQDLKSQVRDAELKNANLVQTIREIKDEQRNRDKDWKVRLERVKEERDQFKHNVSELQEDIASLQAQNSLFSEWMLVRNEYAIVAQRDACLDHESLQLRSRSNSSMVKFKKPWPSEQAHNTNISRDSTHSRVTFYSEECRGDETQYMNESSTRQSSRKWNARTPCGHQIARQEQVTPLPQSSDDRNRQTSISSSCSAATNGVSSSDHERLKTLMTRNRELQRRLQQETMATQTLEQEITYMTS
ncbi:hypothetical protein Plhal304r1_c006g0024101 [Plasmopara halstedii]